MPSSRSQFALWTFGVLALVGSVSVPVFAGGNPTPEIDANTFSAGLGLLAAGVLVIRSRRRR